MRLTLFTIAFLLLATNLHSQTKYYVKTTGSDYNAGTSWSAPFKTIRKALSKATAGQQIWVAAGTYCPDEGTGATNNSIYNSFELKTGVSLYGGFVGNETSLTQRNWNLNQSILSGDIDQAAGSEYSYHVVTSSGVASTARLDGFYIMYGQADGRYNYWGMDDFGGGMYNVNSSPTIANCTFSSNWAWVGAAIYNEGSPITLIDCNFTGNFANQEGGAIYNYYSGITALRCNFTSNSANRYEEGTGAGISNRYSSAYISHCSFASNSSYTGAGINNDNSDSVSIENCLFKGNSASYGGAITNFWGKTYVRNCTIVGNSGRALDNLNSRLVLIENTILYGGYYNTGSTITVQYSLVPEGHAGTGNVSGDAKFKNPGGGDFRLDVCSPAINSGNNDIVSAQTDLGKRPRVVFDRVDIGAYEMQDMENIIYVNDDAIGANNGKSWTNAFSRLQDALASANCIAPTQIWVAAGTYYPDEGNGITDNDPNQYFQIRSGLQIYGNFAGDEDSLHRRRLYSQYESILNGDIDQDGLPAGNSYHVLKGVNADTTSILDGFTITGGNANQDNVTDNWDGGGLYLFSGAPKIRNCKFLENSARYSGGAIYSYIAYPEIINSVFWKNHANEGGAIYNNYACNVQLYNCSFWGNTAVKGGAIHSITSTTKIVNSILWGDQSEISDLSGSWQLSYSIIQGSYYPGTQILNVDPLYLDTANGYLRPSIFSPAIDKGNNAEVRLGYDIENTPRIANGTVDLGAYEYMRGITQSPNDTIIDPIILACPADFMLMGNDQLCGAIASYEGQNKATASWDDGIVQVTYDPSAGSILPPGENTVTVNAVGYVFKYGLPIDTVTASCSFKVQVTDLTPPVISAVTVSEPVLYPPNHKMRDVQLYYSSTDNCEIDTVLLQVMTNEEKPANSTPDWQIVNDHHVKLRAERAGDGTGREYTILITAIDVWGNAASSIARITVPHDNGNEKARVEIAEQISPALNLKVHPNPSSGAFILTATSTSNALLTIRVIDNLGREMEVRKNVQVNADISLGAHYKTGVYYVQVIQGGEVKTAKLVKQ